MILKHKIGKRRFSFLVQLLPEKVIQAIQIKEVLNIKAYIT